MDSNGNVVGHEDDPSDNHVYLDDGGGWDGTKAGLSSLTQIGWEISGYSDYRRGRPCFYIGQRTSANIVNGELVVNGGYSLMRGNDAVLNLVSTSIVSVSSSLDLLEGSWGLIGNVNRQKLAYAIQQTLQLHNVKAGTKAIQGGIMKGLKVAGNTMLVADIVVTGYQVYNDAFMEGKYYSAGARVAVLGAAAGAACIPVVGWGVAIGIGVADIVWGENFYNWVESEMK